MIVYDIPLQPRLAMSVEDTKGKTVLPTPGPVMERLKAKGRSFTKYSEITTTLAVLVNPPPKPEDV